MLGSQQELVTKEWKMIVSNYQQLLELVGTSEYNQIVEIEVVCEHIKNLPNPLPASLQVLSCSSNQLTSLPSLPSSQQALNCDSNRLTSLPSLPAGLQELYCSDNQLTNLPSLPSSLQELDCDGNQLPFTDISGWRLLTRIHRQLYLPAIVKLQRRWRQRRLFQAIKEELVEQIYHPDNLRQAQDADASPRLTQDADASPSGPAKQVGQTWMESRL